MQNHVNLLYREEEREMIPLCRAEGVGLLPWSPMARGRLTRADGANTARSATDQYQRALYSKTEEADADVVAAVAKIAAELTRPMAQVALAWVRQKQGVAAPIIGASKLSHLDAAIAGLDLVLTPEQVARLEAPYAPHAIAGHS
jgi:1-deoxyxylulose-5-phosphate synthase